MRLLRRAPRFSAATDLRLVYRDPDPEVERLRRLREARPSLREIASAGQRGPEGMMDLLERYEAGRPVG